MAEFRHFQIILAIISDNRGTDEEMGTNQPIDLRHDNEVDAGAQVDASALSLAAVFGSVSFPPGMPDYQMIAILERAEQTRSVAGDFVQGNQFGIEAERQRVKEEREQGTDTLSMMIQIAQQEQAEREHERIWSETSHSYARQTMSGEEWKRMKDWFSNDENVAQWEDAMIAETGQSRAEVRQTGGKMKRFYDLMGKDAKGTITSDERREFDALGKDKGVRQGVEVQQETQGIRAKHGYDNTAQSATRLDGSQSEWAASRATAYADDAVPQKGLSAVASLKPSYNAAVAATAPPPVEVKPEEIATRIRYKLARIICSANCLP